MLQLHAADRIEDRANAGQHFRQLFDRHVCAGIALRQAEAHLTLTARFRLKLQQPLTQESFQL